MKMLQSRSLKRVQSILLLIAVVTLSGCSTVMGWFGSEEAPAGEATVQESPVGPVGDRPDSRPLTRHDVQELELKQAKLWARIDELEDQLKRSKERLRVLERGLVLGLTPPELQLNQDHGTRKTHDGAGKNAKPDTAAGKSPHAAQDLALMNESDEADEQAAAKPLKRKNSETAGKEGDPAKSDEGKIQGKGALGGDVQDREAEEEYQRRLATAQEHFRAGRFGQAIAEYSAIGKEFGKKVPGGAHKYWIALSWYNLKENQTAFNAFNEFLTEFPMSPLIPRAKLDMGRVELKLGLKEKAMARFREIMRDFPYEDAAEMARMEMAQLQKNL